jgi:hypothetical protein
MIKNTSILEIKKEERVYQLHCAPDSNLGELHDVLTEMRGFIVNRMVEIDKSLTKPDHVIEVE